MKNNPENIAHKMGLVEKRKYAEPYEQKLSLMDGISISPGYFHGLSKNQKTLALVGALMIIGAVSIAGCTTTKPENSQPYFKDRNTTIEIIKGPDDLSFSYKITDCDFGLLCKQYGTGTYDKIDYCTCNPDLIEKACGYRPTNSSC